MDEKLLKKIKIHKAAHVIVLADKETDNQELEDQANTIRLWALRNHSTTVSV